MILHRKKRKQLRKQIRVLRKLLRPVNVAGNNERTRQLITWFGRTAMG